MRTVHILTTGGTIEKIYSESRGSVENVENKIERYVRRLRLPDTHVEIAYLMNKDSLEMTDADRQQILQSCQQATENAIIIIHGTDTMRETAEVLGTARLDKAII